MQNRRLGNFATRRHQIIGERAGQKRAVVAIAKFFHQRGTYRLREPTAYLAVGERRVEQGAGIVGRDVFVDMHATGVAIDFDATDVEHETVGGGGIDAIVGIGCGELLW